MIAPGDHFELVPAEIVKHEITDKDLISTGYCGILVSCHQETDLLSLRFVNDQRRIVPSVADQPSACEPVDRIAIASGWQPEVERDLARKPCANQCSGIRLNLGVKAAFEMAAMDRYRSFHVACSMHPPHHTWSETKI